jgi:hypothetical protein
MKEFLRTDKTAERYRVHCESGVMNDGCVLCSAAALKTFTYWKIIDNDFPYDLIASTHHMLVPLRHAREQELTEAEWAEFFDIKHSALQSYELLMESTEREKSVPAHHHVHLIVGRDGNV